MNIVFFTRLFYPHIGGVEKHVLKISKILSKNGHSVVVVTENHSWKEFESLNGIQIYRVDVGKSEFLKKFKIWWWLWKHKELILKANVVHCHDVFFWYLPFAILKPMKNVYTTFHGYEGNKTPGIKAKLMHKIAEKMSNRNICVGEFLKKWYGTNPTYITYGAVETVKHKGLSVNKQGSMIKIVFVGRLEEETGIFEYLKAVKILTDKGYKIYLSVLGNGTLFQECKHFVKKSNIDVKFLGFVQDTEKYLVSADFVFTSRYLGVLEALAFKKYVFAVYNNEIKKDYLTMTPFAKNISIAKDADDITKQFEDALKNKNKTKNKIEKGFSWAKKQSWENLTNLYIKLWSK